jgi:hypothetical protein
MGALLVDVVALSRCSPSRSARPAPLALSRRSPLSPLGPLTAALLVDVVALLRPSPSRTSCPLVSLALLLLEGVVEDT